MCFFVLFVFILCLVYQMLPDSLDYPFLIALSVSLMFILTPLSQTRLSFYDGKYIRLSIHPYIINFSYFYFFRPTPYPITKLTSNVPLGILKKCSYFSEWFLSNTCPSLWLSTIFSIFFQTTTCKVTRLSRNVPLGVLKSYWYIS